ncbi:MAG TPA: NAD(P)-dependent oxidoreductase [Candidatus Acidoferrum sp.]|nr:NAD(P)-dependent oxidoreductase [Candidatus Acidoferrum sp.]
MAKIAYLGAGNMGQGMTQRLLAASHSVCVYNRTPEKAEKLKTAGATVASSPRAAAEGAEVIFSSVSDDDASRLVWTGPEGALSAKLAPATFALECSTLSHDWVLELASIVKGRGFRYVDCPVAGRPDAAAAGQLNLFVGASKEDLEAIRPILEPLKKKIFHFGPPGAGTAFKLIYNLMGATQIAALGEAMLVSEAAGIDLNVAAEAFCEGNTGSPHVIRHAPIMAKGEQGQAVAFSARGRLKDSMYGVKLAEKLNRQRILGKGTIQIFEEMVSVGMGASNDSELIEALRKVAGVYRPAKE